MPDEAYDMKPGIACTRKLLLTCRAISTEVAALLYSENEFITQDLTPLNNLSPTALGHLRNLRIVLYRVKGPHRSHNCMEHYRTHKLPLDASTEEGRAVLANWDKTARLFSQHISPGLLNLSLICEVADLAPESRTAPADQALASLSHFPPLASCHIRLGSRRSKTLYEVARKAALRAMARDEKPFRYMELPAEVRLRILQFTELVTPSFSLHWDNVRRYVLVWENRQHGADSRRCDVSTTGCFCSRVHGAYSPDCRCWRDPEPLFHLNRISLAEARDVFYRHHHFNIGYMPPSPKIPKDQGAEYPGTDYFANGIPQSAWRLLRSLKISASHVPWENPEAPSCANWQHTIQRLKEDKSLSLHFLRLNNYYDKLPYYPTLRNMKKEERLEFIRNIVHESFWPLDAGEHGCLPFAARHLEVELRNQSIRIAYRFRTVQDDLPDLREAMDNGEHWCVSRVLPGGRLGGDDGDEASDGEVVKAVDWIEELWIYQLYGSQHMVNDY